MKNFSWSLARSRSCHALRVYSTPSLRLLFIEDAPAAARLRPQPQYILAPETGNGAFKNRRGSGPLTDFLPQLRGDRRVRRPPHEEKRLPDLPLGDKAEER